MKNKVIIIVILFGLFWGCRDRKDLRTVDSSLTHKTATWENGNIKMEGYYSNDTIKEGLFKEYYRNGKLKAQVNYKKNKREGLLIQYYEGGNVDRKINYVDGTRSGIALWYFENGAIKYYQAYGPKGESMFDKEYAMDGTIKNINGVNVLDFSTNKEEFKIGDTLKIVFLVVVPDSCKFQFHVYEDVEKRIGGQDLLVDERDGKVRYERVLRNEGINKWGGFYTIKFKNGKELTNRFGGTAIVK